MKPEYTTMEAFLEYIRSTPYRSGEHLKPHPDFIEYKIRSSLKLDSAPLDQYHMQLKEYLLSLSHRLMCSEIMIVDALNLIDTAISTRSKTDDSLKQELRHTAKKENILKILESL